MIEKEQHHSTAIKQVKRSLLQIIDCFNWISEGNMTAIKLTIHTSEKNSTRVAKLKGLVGSRKEVKQFLDLFRKLSEVLIKEQPHHLEESEQMLD
jgi:sugar diacid utilization regulator